MRLIILIVHLVLGLLLSPLLLIGMITLDPQYKLAGTDSVKTDITKELCKSFSKKTKKVLDFFRS